ncbi:MAG TPA: TonB family protein [Terriglobales bacterium]|nr:TonB family protein [Terriglobales bacterium]
MAELPLPSPSGPEGQTPGAPRLVPANRPGKPDAAAIFSMLREAVASGRFEVDMILGAIAEAAQTLTCATGAAVAMRRGGVMICRGRSGMTAPSLGAQLSINSGISGDCVRTGKTLRCDDTEKDYRADPEVCRRMGIRSIVAVPLHGERGSIGILQVSSNLPSAFSDEHVEILDRLAGMADATGSREARAGSASAKHADLCSVQSVDEVLFGKAIAVDPGSVRRPSQKFWEAIAVLAVLLACVVAWRMWPQAAPAKSSADAQDLSVGTLLTWKPSAAHARTSKNHKKLSTKPNANDLATVQVGSDTETPGGGTAMSVRPESGSGAAELSAAAGSASSRIDAGQRMATVARAQTSTSVTSGTILRRVQPVYPAQALAQHLEGPVILQATIADDGKVQDVTVLRGDPLLARAAADAVKQWQYEPFRADGKPIQKQTEITIDFKAQ